MSDSQEESTVREAMAVTGKVEAVLVCKEGNISNATDKIRLFDDGVEHDRHARHSRQMDVRDKALLGHGLLKGIPCAPTRQVSVVSTEELKEVADRLGILSGIAFGLFNENIVISGIPRLTELPPGTFLCFTAPDEGDKKGAPRTAVIGVWAENKPCEIIGDSLQEAFKDLDAVSARFRKEADGKRGIIGFVMCSGVIKKDDIVTAYIPKQRLYGS